MSRYRGRREWHPRGANGWYRSLFARRNETNPWERIYAEEWAKENDPATRSASGPWGTLQALMFTVTDRLFGNPAYTPFTINRRDAVIVATVVQWFGSSVGHAFICRCLKRGGYDVVPNANHKAIQEESNRMDFEPDGYDFCNAEVAKFLKSLSDRPVLMIDHEVRHFEYLAGRGWINLLERSKPGYANKFYWVRITLAGRDALREHDRRRHTFENRAGGHKWRRRSYQRPKFVRLEPVFTGGATVVTFSLNGADDRTFSAMVNWDGLILDSIAWDEQNAEVVGRLGRYRARLGAGVFQVGHRVLRGREDVQRVMGTYRGGEK